MGGAGVPLDQEGLVCELFITCVKGTFFGMSEREREREREREKFIDNQIEREEDLGLNSLRCSSASRAYTAAAQDFLNLFSEYPYISHRKPTCIGFYTVRLKGSQTTASIEPLASLIRLSIITSLLGRGGGFSFEIRAACLQSEIR